MVFDGWFGLQGWWDRSFGDHRAKLTGPGSERPPRDRPITVDVALQVSTVWACIRLLSETIGTLPLGIYVKDSAGKRSSADGHGLYGLLHDSPNADMSAAEFWEAAIACLCSWGNFYAEKVTNVTGAVIALNVMLPPAVGVRRLASGAREYRFTDRMGKVSAFTEDQVFHIRGFGMGGDTGLSPIGYARRSLGVTIAADTAAANAIENGVRPAGFLTTGQRTLDKDTREDIRKNVLGPVTGASGAARAAVLEAGMGWTDAKGLPPEDLQLLETRAFHIEDMCRWFRVPPFMIGHTEKTTSWGTGLEQQVLGFLTFALRPYLTRIEQAVKKQLLTPADRAKGVYAEFSLEGLMRADSAGRAALYASAAQNGWMTRNEIRGLENLPPVDGGDIATAQINLAPLDKLGDPALSAGAAKAALLNLLGHNGGPALES